MKRDFGKWVGVFAWVVGAFVVAGCKQTFAPFERAVFEPSPDLQSARLSLIFKKEIQSSLAGNFQMGGYGFLFAGPYTASEPFEVGFYLDLSVFEDSNYAKLKHVTELPNQWAIGLPYPIAQIEDTQPQSPAFAFYGYVDTIDKTWLGMAVMFNPPDDPYFPSGAVSKQEFLANEVGRPGVIAGAFGPLFSRGSRTRSGGIAVFANIKQLLLPKTQ